MSHSMSAPPAWLAALGAATAGAGALAAGAAAAVPPPAPSTLISGLPIDTLSPTAASTATTLPPAEEGTSIVALSDSSVQMASSSAMVSPTLTNRSITGTSEKSPMSGTFTSTI